MPLQDNNISHPLFYYRDESFYNGTTSPISGISIFSESCFSINALAKHPWDEPLMNEKQMQKQDSLNMLIPEIGEVVPL